VDEESNFDLLCLHGDYDVKVVDNGNGTSEVILDGRSLSYMSSEQRASVIKDRLVGIDDICDEYERRVP
jgi:hypothetical protein